MKFELEPNHRNVPDEELLADLKRVASKLGRETVTRVEYDKHGKYGVTTFLRRFGKWNKALDNAGLQSFNLQNIPEEELFKNLEEVWAKLGRQPKYGEMAKPLSRYSVGTYEKRFKGWRNALEKFVADVNEEGDAASEETVKNLPIDPISKHKTQRTVNHRLRYLVLKRDNFKCRACGKSPATHQNVDLEVDHIKPWSKSGETVMENLQSLCVKCNSGKSNIE